jgi:hypothetical protein
MSAGEIAATLKADFTGSPDATEIHSHISREAHPPATARARADF